MTPEEDERADLAEYIRLVAIFAMLAVNAWIMWDAVKERPDMLVLRQRVRDAWATPWKKYRAERRAKNEVLWEAMGALEEQEDQHGS